VSENYLAGGCQCGAVRYRLHAQPGDPHLCHCRMCQKAAGNYFMPLGSVRREALEFTRGAPSWFRSSEPVRRGFCDKCGTPLFFDTIGHSTIAVTLGSLDDPSAVKPVSVYGTEAVMPWIAEVCAMPGIATEDDLTDENHHKLESIRHTNHQHPDHETEVWPVEEMEPGK